MRWAMMAAVWVMGCGMAVRAADAPATRPQMSTPKETLKYMDKATLEGGFPAALGIYFWSNDRERSYAESLAQFETDMMELVKVARDRFGNGAGDDVKHALTDETDADVDASTETDDGDRAAVAWKDGGSTPMIRVRGEWKIDVVKLVADLGPGATPEEAERGEKAICEAVRRVTAGMKAGKYGDPAALTKATKMAFEQPQQSAP